MPQGVRGRFWEGPGLPEEAQKCSKIGLGCLLGASRALRGVSEVENRDFVKNVTPLKRKAVFWGSGGVPKLVKIKKIL